MQAVILAAGLGTRMGKLTRDKPKPLLTIQNKTLLEHNLKALPDEITEVVLVVGYLADQIKNLMGGDFRGKSLRYIEQKELKGTGHALSLCKEVVRSRFLVLMGDDLYNKTDLTRLVRYPLAVLVAELLQDNSEDFQALVQVDERGCALNILERQPAVKGALVNCGAYVLDERYFNLSLILAGNKTGEYGLPQTMLQLVKQGVNIEVVKATWWHKVTNPQDLKL